MNRNKQFQNSIFPPNMNVGEVVKLPATFIKIGEETYGSSQLQDIVDVIIKQGQIERLISHMKKNNYLR